MRKLALIALKPGEELPDREKVAEVYHRVANRAGAYQAMYSGWYLTHLSRGLRFPLAPKQAERFVKALPVFEITEVTERWVGK